VNVGLVLLSKDHRFLGCKTIRKYKRITNLFPEANGMAISRILRYIEQWIQAESPKLNELFGLPDQLEAILNQAISNDNNAIQFTSPKIGIDVDLNAALNDLYAQLVEKYYWKDEDKQRLSDEDVWKLKYKSYFEKYGITSRLKVHEIIVPNDIISFGMSWKNEIWHSYEPLSLELKKKDSIKEKVYKWTGKLQALKQADEALHISFLTSINPKHKELMSFVKEYLQSSNGHLKIDVITEDQAESIAESIHKQMELHDSEE
jgi:hypothetical protein